MPPKKHTKPRPSAVTIARLRPPFVVLEDVAKGEQMCRVPRTTCLDLSAVEGAGSPCEDFVPTPLWTRLRWFERLACWLLAEEQRGDESPVAGYIGYLPRPSTFADAPLEWSDAEIAELRYPPVAIGVRDGKVFTIFRNG